MNPDGLGEQVPAPAPGGRRRRRVASRALPPVIEPAFERLGLHRLEADADPMNEASLRVLERLGFRREGLRRERYVQEDEG